mmetsp:Transcript_41308/g.43221  ORF Transcript_41308/g.43221 Transcript_41308/m.43221 type:complete len:212 (+) Transcript_41308:2-637(+)
MSILEKDSTESKLLLQYIKNSHNKSIRKIMRINRPEEELNKNSGGRHVLLFHGTKTFNVLGILAAGLQVSPMESPQTGSAYGNGIYFADKFSLALNYTGTNLFYNNYNHYGSSNEKFYVFVCEVDLGRTLVIKTHKDNSNLTSSGIKNYDSVSVLGNQRPNDDERFVMNDGVEIPLGKEKDYEYKSSASYDSQYVALSEKQVKLRYLVELN